jgi:hypothetical protein
LIERRENLEWAEQYRRKLRRTFDPDACEHNGIDEQSDGYFEEDEWSEGDGDEAEEYEESWDSNEEDASCSESEDALDEEDNEEELKEELADIKHDAQTGWPRWNAARFGAVWRVPSTEDSYDLLDDAQSFLYDLDLDFEIAMCQGEYQPDEVIKLVGELYELMITMAHGEWKKGCISYAPHTERPVNMELAKKLGYSESALYLLERLPYLVDDRLNSGDNRIIADTGFLQYTNEDNLRKGRYMPRGPRILANRAGAFPLDPWILPLAYPSESDQCLGYAIVLDTKLGVVKVWPHDIGPYTCPEFHYANKRGYDLHNQSHWHHFARYVPAVRYLRTLIQAYTDMVKIPRLVTRYPSQFVQAGVRVKYW